MEYQLFIEVIQAKEKKKGKEHDVWKLKNKEHFVILSGGTEAKSKKACIRSVATYNINC